MNEPDSLSNNGTISQSFQSSTVSSPHENASTSEVTEFGHPDAPGNALDISNEAPRHSDGPVDDEAELARENIDFLGGYRPSPEPRLLQLGRGSGLWVWEIVGATLSLSCIVSLFLLLPYLDQSSLSKWQFIMAPNTTISTFITIAKTSILLAVAAGISQLKWVHFTSTKRQVSDLDIFDEASRGPWGAFNFILRMKGRSALTSVGALIVVVSLAMEPFAQQILSFETRSVVLPSRTAQLSIAHSYDDPVSSKSSLRKSKNRSILLGAANPQDYTNPEFRAAFMMGILRSPLQWSFQCSTGNCSWPEFRTLGICASCVNVTSSSEKRVAIDHAVNASNGESGTDIHTTYYTTPSGLELEVFYGGVISQNLSGPHYSGLSHKGWEASLMTSTAAEGQPWDRRLRNPVIAVAAVAVSFKPGVTREEDNGYVGGYQYDHGPADITECSISWCMKQYKGLEVLNGIITQPSVVPVQTPAHDPNEQFYCSNGGFHYELLRKNNTNTEESADFNVSCYNHVAMGRFLVDSLSFTVYQRSSSYYSGASAYITSRLFSRPNVTALFEDITQSLTQHIQTGPNSTLHNGATSLSEIHVIVRWPWIILPALVVIIGAIFLATIIFVNHRSDLCIWKASLKPLLFHGLDGWELDEVDVDSVQGMDDLSKRMKTQLARNEDGRLKLVRASV